VISLTLASLAVVLSVTPTELPELRTLRSHTFDNHDGTFLTEIVPGPLIETDDSMYVFPDSTGYWTGRVKLDGTKYGGNLTIITNPDFRSWARFDLTPIPDTATTSSVSITYWYFASHGDCAARWRHLEVDPLTCPGESLYRACSTSAVVSDSAAEPVNGCTTRVFNAEGIAAVQAGLASDWIAFSWHRAGPVGWRYCSGYEGGDQKIRLCVSWGPPTGIEELPPVAPLPRLVVRPNPARGRAQLVLPGPATGNLEVLDVSGREVWTRRLSGERSGTIQLPILPTGVYLLRLTHSTLDIGHSSLSAKLIVQR
jgi:hypothetical protein